MGLCEGSPGVLMGHRGGWGHSHSPRVFPSSGQTARLCKLSLVLCCRPEGGPPPTRPKPRLRGKAWAGLLQAEEAAGGGQLHPWTKLL